MTKIGRWGWLAAWFWLCTAACGPEPPNLVLVTFDTLRAHRLAEEGGDVEQHVGPTSGRTPIVAPRRARERGAAAIVGACRR